MSLAVHCLRIDSNPFNKAIIDYCLSSKVKEAVVLSATPITEDIRQLYIPLRIIGVSLTTRFRLPSLTRHSFARRSTRTSANSSLLLQRRSAMLDLMRCKPGCEERWRVPMSICPDRDRLLRLDVFGLALRFTGVCQTAHRPICVSWAHRYTGFLS